MISAVDFKSKFLPPMGIKGIAKVEKGWFLGCDLSLDCREGGEDNEQCRDTVHWRKFKDQSLHVSGPSRLCAQAQSGDDTPFHKQAYTEYTRWVFCKLFGRPIKRHLACPTRMHALKGNTRDFYSIEEETGQRHKFTMELGFTMRGDEVTILSDAVKDSMRRQDVSSVIDHYLNGIILEKPFVKQSKLTYDKEEGTVMFEKNDEIVTFKMPHKIEMFKDIEDMNTDDILTFFIASKGDEENKEGYVILDEKSPEALRIFTWMILG
nr:hypothetical protein [Tanacetum cinerariifolium]